MDEDNDINEMVNRGNQTDISEDGPFRSCKNVVENEAMECEVCEQRFHIKCQSITKAEYKYIKGRSKNRSLSRLHWHCSTCDKIAVKSMKTWTSLHIIQEKIMAKMKELEGTLEQKAGKEDFRTLKEEFNQHVKGQKKLAESRAENETWVDIMTNEEATKHMKYNSSA